MNKKFLILKESPKVTEEKINNYLKEGYEVEIVNQELIAYDVGTMCPTYILITSLWLTNSKGGNGEKSKSDYRTN